MSVLFACADREAFEKLPNVTMEGEHTVFRGEQGDVLVRMRQTAASDHVVVADLSVRPRAAQP